MTGLTTQLGTLQAASDTETCSDGGAVCDQLYEWTGNEDVSEVLS